METIMAEVVIIMAIVVVVVITIQVEVAVGVIGKCVKLGVNVGIDPYNI